MINVGDILDEEGVDDPKYGPSEGRSGVEMSPKADGVQRGVDKVGCMGPLNSIVTISIRRSWKSVKLTTGHQG